MSASAIHPLSEINKFQREHVFEWIGTKNQLADILTKSSNAITFSPLWSVILHECQVFLVLYKRGVEFLVFTTCTIVYQKFYSRIPKILFLDIFAIPLIGIIPRKLKSSIFLYFLHIIIFSQHRVLLTILNSIFKIIVINW